MTKNTTTNTNTAQEPWDEVGVVNPQSPALHDLLPFDSKTAHEALEPPVTPAK